MTSDIVAGINYAVDPDGDPSTDDGADIINMSIGGDNFSQAVADAIAHAYNEGVLVIASAMSGSSYPASDPYALAVSPVDANDRWDGVTRSGSLVDLTAPGVDVLTTFVDVDDPAEAIALGGGYGRESGTSMSAPIVAGTAALLKTLHPDWGPNEIAGQLLATADSIGALNAGLTDQLVRGASTRRPPWAQRRGHASLRWSAWAIRMPTCPICEELNIGDVVDVQFSHAMDSDSVLDPSHYQLRYLGDPATTDDDQTVELSLVTEALPAEATGVTDADDYYVSFPGRGVQLQVDGIAGVTSLPSGPYRLTVSGMTSVGSGTSLSFTHEFQIPPRANFGEQQVILESETNYPQSVFVADLDGDGDMDLLSASQGDDKIAWYENTDGAGTFGPQHVITQDADYAQRVFAADLDGDGDVDVLSASSRDNKIAWYENTDGAGTFGPQRVITLDADGAIECLHCRPGRRWGPRCALGFPGRQQDRLV